MNLLIAIVIALGAAAGSANLPIGNQTFTGKVVGVTDGDTITVLRDNTQTRVRLHGIDAPESGQDFGEKAKQYTSSRCFGKTVTIIQTDVDRYGRIVARVKLPDGIDLSHELVADGFAWWYTQYAPNDNILRSSQNRAQTAQRGLWSQKNPTPPWYFRSSPPAQPRPNKPAAERQPVAELLPVAELAEAPLPESPTVEQKDPVEIRYSPPRKLKRFPARRQRLLVPDYKRLPPRGYTTNDALRAQQQRQPLPINQGYGAENGDLAGRDNDGDGRSESVYVQGHYRNGKYVRGHYRATPRR